MTTELSKDLDQAYRVWIEDQKEEFLPLSLLVQFLNSPKGKSLVSLDFANYALEIGCGARSIFSLPEMTVYGNLEVRAIDLSQVAINYARTQYPGTGNIHYQVYDALDLYDRDKYQVIVDAHCLHSITRDRELFLENIKNCLSNGGVFVFEAMVSHKGMTIDEGYSLEKNILYKGEIPQKYIPSAIELEVEILGAGFEIDYFCHCQGVKLIPNDQRTRVLNSDPDVFRVVARKK